MSTPFYDLASLVVVPSGYKASKVYAQKPLTTDGQLTFSRGSTATRVNASGLIETVSSNVPRLDYTNSSCPKLILEPSRTNLSYQSNDFFNWPTKVNATVTDNYAVSPDGTTNADRIVFTGNGFMYGSNGYSQTTGTVYTLSIYAKRNGSGTQSIGFFVDGSGGINSPWALTSNWQRFTYTYTAGNNSVVGIGAASGADVSVYGFQFEAGAYVSSYIPTTTAAVTRLADAASKTGISSLIGQTAGTMFIHVKNIKPGPLGGDFASIDDGTGGNRIQFFLNTSNKYGTYNEAGSATQWFFTSNVSPSGNDKIAIAYASNGAVLYINGQQVGSTNSFTAPSTSVLKIGDRFDNAVKPDIFECSQALLFKTRLTNAQLAELTAL